MPPAGDGRAGSSRQCSAAACGDVGMAPLCEASGRRVVAGNGCPWRCSCPPQVRKGVGVPLKPHGKGAWILLPAGDGRAGRSWQPATAAGGSNKHAPLFEAGVRLLEWRRGLGGPPG